LLGSVYKQPIVSVIISFGLERVQDFLTRRNFSLCRIVGRC
jgi:hypothetical protein